MGLRRPGVTKEYEEMPGANVPMPSKHIHHSHLHNQNHSNTHLSRNGGDLSVCQDLEMSSVSVVPDGEFSNYMLLSILLYSFFFFWFFVSFRLNRHLHGYTSRKCVRVWMVSSQIVAMRGTLLDGRLDGNDDIECPWASIAL